MSELPTEELAEQFRVLRRVSTCVRESVEPALGTVRPMSIRRPFILKLGLAIGAVLLTVALVIGAEQYTTYKLRDVGWNYRGYRGPVLGWKGANEFRVFAIGGSTTYGYTLMTADSYPAQLERKLNARLSARGIRVSVANLGHLSDSSVCYYPTYRDYEYLAPDIVIIYEGYNDVGGTRRTEFDCYRQSSTIFRWTGFFPTLAGAGDSQA